MLFLDESGRLDQGGLFALGGIAVHEEAWPELRDTWQATLREAGWPLDREVKWHGIRTGEVPPDLGDALFAALSRAPFRCYVTVLDLDRGPEAFAPADHAFFRSPEDVYATALMFPSGSTISSATRTSAGSSSSTAASAKTTTACAASLTT